MKSPLSIMAILAGTGAVLAGPVVIKRQYAPTDIQILNYALTLEHLEDTFYREGLLNYTQADFINAGFPDPFYANLVEIASDEKTHVSFLTSAFGAQAVVACTYAFPATTPAQFVALASILEGVGVSAFLGAAASILDKSYLADAASILTIEARHSAYIRSALHKSPFPAPFDTPLDFGEVYTLAAPLIASCPASNPALPVKAFPALVLAPSSTAAGPIMSGTTILLLTPGHLILPPQQQHSGSTNSSSSASSGPSIYAAFITITGPIFVPATPAPAEGGYTATVPQGVSGQSYVVLTGCNRVVSDDTIAAGPAIVEVTNV